MRRDIHRLRSGMAALWWTAAVVLVGPGPAAAQQAAYTVEIAADVAPRMDVAGVVQVVAARTARPIRGVQPGPEGRARTIPSQPRILSVECMRLESLLSRFPSIRPVLDAETVWLVRVQAPFFRPRANGPPIFSDKQFFVLDDETGAILGGGIGL